MRLNDSRARDIVDPAEISRFEVRNLQVDPALPSLPILTSPKMPPRLRSINLQPNIQPSLPATPPYQCLCKRQSNPRQFSTSPQHATRLRRTMFRWLQGPGAAFKDPLPGSTNYLNAYDDSGRLYRVLENARPRTADETSPTVPRDDDAENPREKNIAGGNELPRETKQDLIPFPLNRNFSSQAVLSEELREEIWARVVLGRRSVKLVSAELGVEMNRIGAVVRLKMVEKEWIRKVRRSFFFFLCNPHLDVRRGTMMRYK